MGAFTYSLANACNARAVYYISQPVIAVAIDRMQRNFEAMRDLAHY